MELRVLAPLLLPLLLLCTRLSASTPRALRFEMSEELRPPARIGSLSNLTLSAAGSASFRLLSAPPFLRVSESGGELTLTERVDREALCKRNARCVLALDVALAGRGSGARLELLRVEVEVLDVNDHAPAFPSTDLVLEVSEAAKSGTRLPVEPARDPDLGSNSVQGYRLLSESAFFSVETVTRVDGVRYPELVLLRSLDRETKDVHALRLEAVDGGTPPLSGSVNLTVRVLDANDNSPVFDRALYGVELAEDAEPGQEMLQLHASDPDLGSNGQVVFEYGTQTSTDVRRLFRLDRSSGRVTLSDSVDFEEQAVYEVHVQAADLGSVPAPPTNCKIIIRLLDVNDNSPEVRVAPVVPETDGAATVSEDSGADVLVAVVTVSDRDSGDNGRVTCRLQGAHAHFRLRRAYEGSYTIVTAPGLDREKISQYNLSVEAEDFGTPPLRSVVQYVVVVTDVNDNAPVFSARAYEGFIEENQLPGTYITTVTASDPDAGANGELTYELLDSDTGAPSRFAVMNQAGHVYALQSFNHEVTPRIELRVQASDRGWPPLRTSAKLVIAVVDQNDNAPSVVRPVLQNGSAEIPLPRDAGPGYVVTQIRAKDADSGSNAQLTYRLAQGTDSGFSIDLDTGEIYTSRRVSYDTDEDIKVTVLVSDHGVPSLTSTATIRFSLSESVPSSDNYYSEGDREESTPWVSSIVFVVIFSLTGSSVLLLAAVLLFFLCGRRKSRASEEPDPEDRVYTEKEKSAIALISDQTPKVFDPQKMNSMKVTAGSTEVIHCSVQATEDTEDTEDTLLYKNKYRTAVGHMEGYSTLPGYGKDSMRSVTVWKGNSMVTVSARDPHISGKDSGKGDSDVNDSDSDISGEHRKDISTYKGLWACTSECRVLGHSDRCWSPSASRTSGVRHLSTFSRTTPSPLNAQRSIYLENLASRTTLSPLNSQRTVHYENPVSRTGVLQSVAESRHCDYIHICSPQSQRRTSSEEPETFSHSTKPIPAESPERFSST
ncbi:protocadherin-8 [Hoplias malabaricus]|uniref:protocadherin-8 n=1 Tax=Hoplias malabaricus TaxID=27720 RepID=UPI003462480A